MIKIQANTGSDLIQNWVDLSSTDYIIFSNGQNGINTGFTGVQKIVNEFNEIDSVYGAQCHLMRGTTIQQINYNGSKLYNAQALFLADPDQSDILSKFSFRFIFADYVIDWIKVPQVYTKVPVFFYGQNAVDTVVTPFLYTTHLDFVVDNILELDERLCIITKIETVGGYRKIYVRPIDDVDFQITKEKYIIRNFSIPDTDSSYTNICKIMFHDENISLDLIPNVDISSDITDATNRVFSTTYEQANIDISNTPFFINLDSTLDLTGEMLIDDFIITQNIGTGDAVIYFTTAIFTDIKKGDHITIKNDVYAETMIIDTLNYTNHSSTVIRPYTKYAFLTSDDSVTAFLNKIILFQPVVLNDGEKTVNYPTLFVMEVKYLNI